MLVSQCAVMTGWLTMTLDITKAFLQGMNYDEIARRTGEPQREVTFALPRGADAVLRPDGQLERLDLLLLLRHRQRRRRLRLGQPG